KINARRAPKLAPSSKPLRAGSGGLRRRPEVEGGGRGEEVLDDLQLDDLEEDRERVRGLDEGPRRGGVGDDVVDQLGAALGVLDGVGAPGALDPARGVAGGAHERDPGILLDAAVEPSLTEDGEHEPDAVALEDGRE